MTTHYPVIDDTFVRFSINFHYTLLCERNAQAHSLVYIKEEEEKRKNILC